ncbi:MAG: hypothetical protein ACLUVB_08235, partial [Acutalibacteraceae bacterium]
MNRFLLRRLPRGGTMRTRLILSFSVPVLAVMLLVLAGVHSILLSGSESQVLSTARSSYDQAYELATSYIELMLYASDSIYYNGDLQRILSSRDYLEEMPAADRYREFLVLDDVFSMAENVELIYRTGIYLNSEIPYTNNLTHIMPLETLFERADYARYVFTMQRDRFYFSAPVNLYTAGSDTPVRAVTLLRPVRATDGSDRQLCVEQVSVEVESFSSVLAYAQATEGSTVYLVNEYGELIAATDSAAYRKMERDGALPADGDDAEWTRTALGGRAYYVLRRHI